MAPPSLGVVCFRRRFPQADDEDELDRLNAGLIKALEQSGLGLVSSTVLKGCYAIRVCVLNHTTGRADLERVLDFLESAEPALDEEGGTGYERDRQMQFTPIRRRVADADASGAPAAMLADVPLFATWGSSRPRKLPGAMCGPTLTSAP